jgi:hypothetical protein
MQQRSSPKRPEVKLTLQNGRRYTVRTFNSLHDAGLGAPYGLYVLGSVTEGFTANC